MSDGGFSRAAPCFTVHGMPGAHCQYISWRGERERGLPGGGEGRALRWLQLHLPVIDLHFESKSVETCLRFQVKMFPERLTTAKRLFPSFPFISFPFIFLFFWVFGLVLRFS